MTDETTRQGKTTIAPDVLISIARLSALSVPGVHRFVENPKDVSGLFKSKKHNGVVIEVEGNTVYADLYLILKGNMNVKSVCENVQTHVAREISQMVGLEVGRINIHVEDIFFE